MTLKLCKRLRDFFRRAAGDGSEGQKTRSQTAKNNKTAPSPKTATLGEMNAALDGFVDILGLGFKRRLRETIASYSGDFPDDSPEEMLNRLYVAITHQDSQHLFFRYEETKPASEEFRDSKFHFHEALFTIKDNQDNIIPVDKLFDALGDTPDNKELGSHFRLLLIFRQIQHFSRKHNGRLSVNIRPDDIDKEWFRYKLKEGLYILNEDSENWSWKNDKRLILEAVENGDWNISRLKELKALQEDTGVKLAIDDYGSEYNNEILLQRLSILNRGKMDSDLIIKLDGALVTDFVQADDIAESHPLVKRLQEIRQYHAQAQVVLEWANNEEEIVRLKERLAPYGLDGYVQLVQSRELEETPKQQLLDDIKKVEKDREKDREKSRDTDRGNGASRPWLKRLFNW